MGRMTCAKMLREEKCTRNNNEKNVMLIHSLVMLGLDVDLS